jgi:hypothetical protein
MNYFAKILCTSDFGVGVEVDVEVYLFVNEKWKWKWNDLISGNRTKTTIRNKMRTGTNFISEMICGK